MFEWLPLVLFLLVILVLLWGYPVAFSLAGTALLVAVAGIGFGWLEPYQLNALGLRLFGVISNEMLIAVPLFVFMGVMLERSRIAEELLESMTALFGTLRGGMGLSVTIVGMLLAASTGIVGATVVTMGLLSLPAMLKQGYDPRLATGTICASGTLGQIIPPSIVLILLGSVLTNALTEARSDGLVTDKVVSIGDLFMGAIIPGLLLVALYMLYIMFTAWRKPESAPAAEQMERDVGATFKMVLKTLLPPLLLIVAVLGSILGGIATATEAAAVGSVGALVLAAVKGQLTLPRLTEVVVTTTKTSAMVFMILIGASIFSLVFRALEGDAMIQNFFSSLPGGVITAMITVMLVMFVLGFILDFIEITFVVVPLVAPPLLLMGLDPVWLGIMIAINLQTSFLTPPFGFALFYLRGVAPPEVTTRQIYQGVIPFIGIQIAVLLLLALWPEVATWLPEKFYGS